MGREIYIEDGSLESRPGVFLIGSPNVGKRTLLSRLLSIDISDTSDLSGGILCQGWTIDTKYYSADISIWTAHLNEDFSFGKLPISKQLAGLVMVFDMSDESSFHALKDWAACIDLEKFEILLCIGNKADLVPGHSAHTEHRRYLQRHGESTSDPHPEYRDYGIDEGEADGCSLLGEEEPSLEIRKSCLDWCIEHNIEYVEACASNADFDKCLSVDGDIQGVQRLNGALSAHMWPGMVMKSGESISIAPIIKNEETTDEESDYEIEYEVLSRGSDEPWEYVGVSCNELLSTSGEVGFVEEQITIRNSEDLKHETFDEDKARVDIPVSEAAAGASSSHSNDLTSETGTTEEVGFASETVGDKDQGKHDESTATCEVEVKENTRGNPDGDVELDEDSYYGHEDPERLMCEIGSMRANLRLMPDVQRREMAAKLAMKMASMFGEMAPVFGESSDDANFDQVVA